jgi:hypothetical protein
MLSHRFAAGRIRRSADPWPVCPGLPFHNFGGPQGRGYSCDVERFTITSAAVISNHRIDRLESVRGVDGTAPG